MNNDSFTPQRRQFLGAMMALAGWGQLATATAAGSGSIPSQQHHRLLLNTGFSGPVAFFLLAQDKGYFRNAGLTVELASGPGAAAMVPLVREGAYDVGYGDISALIERIANSAPDTGPVAIYTTFNVNPFTIAVAADGPIRRPQDLIGRRVTGHASDAALLTFDLYADAANIVANRVHVDRSMGSMGSAVKDMLDGRGADGVFGFVNTLIASAAPFGVSPSQLRFLNWSDVLPEMYGNTLFVTREAHQRDLERGAPDAGTGLAGLVRAVNRGLMDTIKSPSLAMESLSRHAPGSDIGVNLRRLQGTLAMEMAHPEGARLGIGEMDDQRLAKLIQRIVKVKRLPRTPSVREVFDRRYLPPVSERIFSLARQ